MAQLATGRFLNHHRLPWLPRTRSSDSLVLTPVMPVARRPETAWWPSRHCLGWPRLRDADDLQDWLSAETAADEVAYCLGNLGEARARDARLDLLAFALMARTSACIARTSACGHQRGGWLGSGCVTLRQQPVGPGFALYLARRRATPPSADEIIAVERKLAAMAPSRHGIGRRRPVLALAG